jgi:lipoyl(octanoyl) transferase
LGYRVEYKDVGLKDYKETWELQEKYFSVLVNRKTGERKGGTEAGSPLNGTLIFVEHPHVYTLGKSGSENNLLLDFIQLSAKDASFYRIDRGGDITYHGPGQIVGYPIFDLEAIGIGLKEYIHKLEDVIIRSIEPFGLKGERLDGGTGVWLEPYVKGRARKICAIGVRASRYITMHGFAFNVNTDLSYFGYINPCGFTDKGVTSLARETGTVQDIEKIKIIVREEMKEVFGLELIKQAD